LALPSPDRQPDASSPRRTARSGPRSDSGEASVIVETAMVATELEKLISGRARDLEVLKSIAESMKAGATQADIHRKLLVLARSSREAFQSLQSSRDRLISLHNQSNGGKTATVVDEIAGMPNAAAFKAKLEETFHASAATFDTVLMLIDIGALQYVATEKGLRIANRIMRRFAAILRKTVKHTDFMARIGPQHFGIIFRNVLPDYVAPIALRIHDVMEKKLYPGTDPVMQMLQVTIGITGNKIEDESAEDLMHRAEGALLMARKQLGAKIYLA
jgi:diguanylate cyclase (GGDEF)-like protein